jgi:tryptophan 2,3-dioxygenase
MMVRRMIGMRVGTGGTSGKGYLEETLAKHHIFKELTEVTTFVVKRSKLPALPNSLKEHTGFAL